MSTSFSFSFIVSGSLTFCSTMLIEKSNKERGGRKRGVWLKVLVQSSGNGGNNNNNIVHTLSLWAKCASSCNLRALCWFFSNVVCTFSSLRCIYCYMFFFFLICVFFQPSCFVKCVFPFFWLFCVCVCVCACTHLFSLL